MSIAYVNQILPKDTAQVSIPNFAPIAGSVLQVVQTVKTDTASIAGTTFIDVPGYSVTITPQSTSNKVVVDVCLHVGENQDAFPIFRMYRNGVELQIAPAISPGNSGMFGKTTTGADARDQYLLEPVNFKFLDTPNTTSAITYTLKCRPMGTGSRTIYFNRSQTIGDTNQYTVISTFTATEIAQ